MVLGLLSDTHLAAADGRLDRLLSGPLGTAEVLLHAGDHTAEAVVDHLEFVEQRPYHGVAGNTDAAAVARRLPGRRVLDLGGCRVGLVHGWGAPGGIEDRVRASFGEPVDLIVFGHSHVATRTVREGTVLVNPGAPFGPRGGRRGTVALVTLGPSGVSDVRFVEV